MKSNPICTSGRYRDRVRITSASHPFWDLAFRPFFLLGTALGVIAVLFWVAFLNGWNTPIALEKINPTTWHLHEMLFGFAGTCAVGFLLTAAQTWTSVRSVNGVLLVLLTSLWILARIAIWNGLLVVTILIQSVWWFASISALAKLLITRASRRNYQFLPLLAVMATLNISILALEYVNRSDLALHLGRTAILLFGILVSLVSGRIIPLFTQNATGSNKIKPTSTLDVLILLISILGALVFFFSGLMILPVTPAYLMLTAGSLHLYRLSHWDSLATRAQPLLWSLHATYLCLGLGLILLGTSYFSASVRFSDALHLSAVGAIGGMILAVVTRVSLGHTGRPLHTNRAINAAFSLILFSAATRVLFPFFGEDVLGRLISALMWIVSFSIFVYQFFPILTRARQN